MNLLWRSLRIAIPACLFLAGCGDRPGGEGAKIFLGLGICLAAVFLVFYIVVKVREKQ